MPQPIRPLGCFLRGLGVESCLRVVACCGSLIDPCCTHRNCYKKLHFQVANVAGAGLRVSSCENVFDVAGVGLRGNQDKSVKCGV